ncbi:MAG: 50S ribosomal protein L11 methyltransferase [Prevotella sp.]|nr:50S ribosomal protein L11 methyltransferase [Prevotella sp.]
MKYYAVDFRIECSDDLLQTCRELLADSAGEVGFESFEDTEQGIMGYVQTDLFDREGIQQTVDNFPIDGVNITYEVSEVEDCDWNATWEEAGFDPIIVNGKCIIYDARQQGSTPLSSLLAPLRIGIHARMAFGTGTHETTRMVVSKLTDMEINGWQVLDCGCGTGILAIVAAKLGAKHVVAYDIDEWSVENTRHNAQLNQVENIIDVLHGDSSVLSHVSGVFRLVVANINRNVLLADMHAFCDVMAHGGILVLSGFYTEDIPILLEEASKHDLTLIDQASENNWACLVMKHK